MPSRDFSTSRRLLTFAAAAGACALLTAVVFLWPSDPADYAPVPRRAQPDGETIGWVSKMEANTIHVNSGPFGGGVVPLVISRNTRITVGSKEGWFEDIRPGGQVKVAYDVFEGRRMARTVEILVDEGARGVNGGAPRLKSATGVVSAERTPAVARPPSDGRPPAADKADESAARPAPVAASPAPASTVAAEKHAPAPTVRTAPRPEPARTPAAQAALRPEPEQVRAVQAAPRAEAAPARSAPASDTRAPETLKPAATTPPIARSESRRSAEGGTTDGSDAVDWLLKQRN